MDPGNIIILDSLDFNLNVSLQKGIDNSSHQLAFNQKRGIMKTSGRYFNLNPG